MNANLTEILKTIPDFEDFMNLSNEIAELSLRKMRLENQIEQQEAETFRTAMKTPLQDGKLPSVSFVTNAYMKTGINGELQIVKDELAFVTSELDKKKMQFSIYKEFIGIFQTISANERSNGF